MLTTIFGIGIFCEESSDRDYAIVFVNGMSYQSIQEFTHEVIEKSARWRYYKYLMIPHFSLPFFDYLNIITIIGV